MSIPTVMVMAIAISVPAHSQDLAKALKGCGSIAENDARLTCFDAVGKERVEPKKADEREKYSSRVAACQESAQSGQYYFTLDNGQVWKQSNYRRLGFRDCAFDIELSKGSLGYQMYIPS